MQIALSAKSGAEIMVLPFVPSGIPIPTKLRENEGFQTQNGELTLFGPYKRREIGWEGRLPKDPTHLTNPRAYKDPYRYVENIQKWVDEKIPIRIIITSSLGKNLLNMPCTVDEFDYALQKNGDLTYTIKLVEYIFAAAKKV